MSDNGLVTLQSAHNFVTTLARIEAALNARGITLFMRIDHAAGASGVGLSLRPTTLLLFGSPLAGTPLMQAAQTAGIDLPLKALIWQDAAGTVNLTYNDPEWIAARHALGEDAQKSVTVLAAGVQSLARQATES
ncbi:MAG TPA: DUF302 domain-containing protein [Acetobacteraceae bacterium]|jgi:uncharacterized protein (DUF302 family)|nr:DUF302 domain-containing protein [Acetobacteraceae bacterium]